MNQHSHVSIKVKPNAKKTEFLTVTDIENSSLPSSVIFTLAVSAQPEHNKANIAVIKFISSLLKKKVNIVSGTTSKLKIVKVLE